MVALLQHPAGCATEWPALFAHPQRGGGGGGVYVCEGQDEGQILLRCHLKVSHWASVHLVTTWRLDTVMIDGPSALEDFVFVFLCAFPVHDTMSVVWKKRLHHTLLHIHCGVWFDLPCCCAADASSWVLVGQQ